jgi:hypothetical protein
VLELALDMRRMANKMGLLNTARLPPVPYETLGRLAAHVEGAQNSSC